MVHIPYRGAAPAATDLAAGRVDFFFVSYSSLLPFLQGGKVRALAVTSPNRLPALPDAPTMTEAGFAGVALASTPAEFTAFIASETERLGKLVRAVGAKAE